MCFFFVLFFVGGIEGENVLSRVKGREVSPAQYAGHGKRAGPNRRLKSRVQA